MKSGVPHSVCLGSSRTLHSAPVWVSRRSQRGGPGSSEPELRGQPKVCQLDAAAVVDEQVGEGDVAVGNAAAVEVVQRGGQLLGDGGGQRLRERAVSPHEFVQVAMPAQLHHQVNAVGVLERALSQGGRARARGRGAARDGNAAGPAP